MSNTQRQFTLVGDFTDNITPALNSINNTLNQLRQNFASLSQSVTPLNRSLSQLSATSRSFGQSLSSRTTQINAVTSALNNYTRAANAANRASTSLNRSSGGGGGGFNGGRSSGGGGGRGGYRGGYYGGDSFAGQMVSYQLANDISNAVLRGFQMGVSLMEKPFQYAIGAFGERMKDEMSDIQAAGGLLAISQRKGLDLFPSFASAMRELQKINHRLAQSAAALPGSTEEYVRQGKLISDTVMGGMGKDPAGFTKFGQELGAKVGNKMDSLAVIIQKLTEKSVLLQQGTITRSPLGVPQLIEQMINAPKMSPGSFNKYVAFRYNPILSGAFQDPAMQRELASTAAGTAERMRVVMKLLDQAIPNEVVQAYRNSLGGFMEAFRSSFLDPEVGLFGLGRKFKSISRSVDEFGRYLDKEGKLAKRSTDIYMESYSLFELFSQAVKGFGLPLSEITSILPDIWDPLRGLAELMAPLAGSAQEFYSSFNRYTKWFEGLAKGMGLTTELGRKMKETSGARGFILALANLLWNLDPKRFGLGNFNKVLSQLENPRANLAKLTKDLLTDVFQTQLPFYIGKTIGGMVGTVIKILGDIMSGATNMAETGPFAEGLMAGWKAAKGSEGVQQVFSSLFKVIGGTLLTLFQTAPKEMLTLTALTVGMPVIQNVIVFGLITLFSHLGEFIRGGLSGGSLLRQLNIGANARRAYTTAKAGISTVPPRSWTSGLDVMTWFSSFPQKAGARFVAGLKVVSSKLLFLGGAISAISAIMNGKSLLEAIATGLGSAGGTAIGAAIGTVILPGVGTWVGALLGSQLGEMKEIVEPITIALRDFWSSMVYTGGLISQIWKDLENAIKSIKGVDRDFNLLAYAVNLLLSPFTLLKLGILGLTEAYLQAKKNMPFVGGLTPEEKKNLNDARYARLKGTAEYFNRVDPRSVASKKADIESRLRNIRKGELGAPDREEILKLMLKDLQNNRSSLKAKPPVGSPAQVAEAATSNIRTASNTSRIQKKSEEQLVQTTRINQNTKTSSGILGNIKSALFVISEKLDILNSMLYALEKISVTLKESMSGSMNAGFKGIGGPDLGLTNMSSVEIASGSLPAKTKALLAIIRAAEGTSGPKGYQTLFGGGTFSDLSRHPGIAVSSGRYTSDAAGAYQILGKTYRSLGGGSFTEANQDRMALQLIARRGINPLAFEFSPNTINKLAPEWASLPTLSGQSYYGQPVKAYSYLKRLYEQYLNHFMRQEMTGRGSVAMALGPSNPAFFATRQQAEAWERKMMPVGAKVTSFTTNSSEGFGTTTINAPITIHQQPGQDAEELAAIVVARFNMAVQQMRNHYA